MGTSLSMPKGGRIHSKIVGRKAEQRLLSNGEVLLEKLLTSFDGKCNPLRLFSARELAIATCNYRHLLHQDGFFKTYRGFLAGCSILVKYFDENHVDMAINEAAFASLLSSHNNILTLLGCCLESEAPILVYESAENGILTEHIWDPQMPLPWNYRLKVAKEIADAVAYLHGALSTPIVHKDILACCIFLDGNYVAKLSGFYLSLSIPLGEDSVEESIVMGTTGSLPPEYAQTGKVTEKCDVYSFARLLFEIISGGTMSEILVDIYRSKEDDQHAFYFSV